MNTHQMPSVNILNRVQFKTMIRFWSLYSKTKKELVIHRGTKSIKCMGKLNVFLRYFQDFLLQNECRTIIPMAVNLIK